MIGKGQFLSVRDQSLEFWFACVLSKRKLCKKARTLRLWLALIFLSSTLDLAFVTLEGSNVVEMKRGAIHQSATVLSL